MPQGVADNPPAEPAIPPSARVRLWLLLASAALVTLGAVVLFGWLTQSRTLVGVLPGFPPTVINTAIMFSGSGLALALLTFSKRLGLFLALGVELLALAILSEHLLAVDLGIDQASAHLWAYDGHAAPGRAAQATALAFAIAAAALSLLFVKPTQGTLRFAQLLAALTLVVSAGSVIGLALGLDVLYQSYLFRGMSIPTSVGLFLLGSALLIAIRAQIFSSSMDQADHRIISVGTLLLITVALATGLPMFFVVKTHIESSITTGLQTGLDTEVQLIDNILSMRAERAAIISNRPDIVAALKALQQSPADALALGQLQTSIDQFRPHGFSALRVVLPAGQVLASSGQFQTAPSFEVVLDSPPEQRLQWNEGYVLRSQEQIRDGESVLASIEMEQPLPQMVASLSDGEALGKTGELQLCKQDRQQILCFPSRFQPKPLRLDLHSADPHRLILQAAQGGFGIHRAIDHRGAPVVGVYAPVKNQGLFVALKIDAAELYNPLRRQIENVLTLALLTIIGGSLLFRNLVRPLAEQLVVARESSQDKSRTMQSLLAFQRAVFEQAPDGILVADHKGRIVEANERIAKLFGYSREAMRGMQIEELVPQSVRSQHHMHRAAFQKAPSTRVMSRDRTLQGQRADGSEFPIEVALAPMSSDAGDRVIAIIKDVSEARQAEQALRDVLIDKDRLLRENDEKSRVVERLHAFQRAVFEQAPDGILVADEDGRIVEANERMAGLFGYSRDGLAGRRIEDLVPQQVRTAHHLHRAAFQKAPSTRIMSRDRTLNGQRSDGSAFPIEVALAPLLTTDGNRVIAIVKDVTEARESERLIRDALKEKDLLLGEIHHRVKNNLQIVHSLLDMQAEMTTDAGAASALRDSQARIQSMALIHQTLYQSHDFAKVDFGVFLDTLMSHLQDSYGRSDLSLTSRSDTVRLAIDRAIPCGLIVNELVTNALKHAFPEHRSGSVLVDMRVLEDGRVEVAVIDDGVGIPESVNLKALTSLGMQLVQVLSEQLHAELTVQRRDPTRISFSFAVQ